MFNGRRSSTNRLSASIGAAASAPRWSARPWLAAPAAVQSKLRVGDANDPYEREADQIAEQVMRTPGPGPGPRPVVGDDYQGLVRRLCDECSEELQRAPQSGAGPALDSTAGVGAQIDQVRNSSGASLPGPTRGFFESRFEHDFSAVRVHTDQHAADSAARINARAYTLGHNIAFAAGQYSPHSAGGRSLLAHELTHVVQQSSGAAPGEVQRTIGDAHDLSATRFSGNRQLEAAYDNERLIQHGHAGTHVRLIQESLLAQGYALPVFGADGDFGDETAAAVLQFQTDAGAEMLDSIVGPETMKLLDMRDPGGTATTGPAPRPVATGVAFSAHPSEPFAGYDNTTAPNDTLVVPTTGRRLARANPVPARARPAYVSADPAVASVNPTPDGVAVTGVADGATQVRAEEGGAVLGRLNIEVKDRLERTVDYHFMRDSAVPPHRTARTPAQAPILTSTLNRVWERQANVRWRTGTVDSPVIPDDLGGTVLWTAAPVNEWDTVTAFATGGNFNVFLVWEYEQDATPLVDDTNAGTLAGNCLLEDNECGDALTVAHEAGHFLGLGHVGRGIMTGCPGVNRRWLAKVDADTVNP